MKPALKMILQDPALTDECKQQAIALESAVQWYLAACDATAYRIQWSPLRAEQSLQVAA